MPKSIRPDEQELADAIRKGARCRHEQMFGAYFEGTDRSDALGAAYEAIYRLPPDATGIRPRGIYKFFACLDDRVRRCPEPGCIKQHFLDTLIVHLNDDHQWSRERIAAYIDGQREAQAPAAGKP
jgi:hypothetical protein